MPTNPSIPSTPTDPTSPSIPSVPTDPTDPTLPPPSAEPTVPAEGESVNTKEWTPNCNEYISLRATPGGNGFTTVPLGARLELVKWYGTYALVDYNGVQGYVLSNYIKPIQKNYFADRLPVVGADTLYTYDKMLEDMTALQSKYPHLVRIETMGISEMGRNIPVMILGDRNASKHILVQGAMHGREYATAWLAMAVAEHSLSKQYFSQGNVCYHIIPMINPDGVIISQSAALDAIGETIYSSDLAAGYTRYSKETYAQQWKANALGVDLNRNFPSGWENTLEHTGPSSEKYRGTAPFSAAEAAALRDYTLKYDFSATLSLHAYGSVLYYQYGTKQPVNNLSYSLAKAVEAETGYLPMVSDGTTGAGYKDWAMDALGIPSLTVEIGCVAPPLAARDLYNIFARFENIVPALSDWVLTNR